MLNRLTIICLLGLVFVSVSGTEAGAAKCAKGATFRCVSSGGTRLCSCWKTGSEICDVDVSVPGSISNCTSGVNCPVLTCSVYGTVDLGDGLCNPKILDPDCGIEGLAFTLNSVTDLFTTDLFTTATYQTTSQSFEASNRSFQGKNRPSQTKYGSYRGKKRVNNGRHGHRPHPTPVPTPVPTPIPTPVPTPIPTPTPPQGEPVILETVLTRSAEIERCTTSVCEKSIELDLTDCPDCEDPDSEFMTFTAREFNSEVCVCPGGFSTTGDCCTTTERLPGGSCVNAGEEVCLKQLCKTDLTDYEPGVNLPYTCTILPEPKCVEKYFVRPGEIRCRR